MNQKLSEIKSKIDQLAKIIGASQDTLPTYGYSEQTARPHIEADSISYHFVIAERGQEFERHSSFDMNEILYDVFQVVTFELACKYELDHRINGQDSRRIMFEYQEELLSKLSLSWGERRIQEHAQILEKHPFNDIFNPVSAYAQELRDEGFPPEVRWKMAREKFHLPKDD